MVSNCAEARTEKTEAVILPIEKILPLTELKVSQSAYSKNTSKSIATAYIPTSDDSVNEKIFTSGNLTSRIEINQTEYKNAVTETVSSSEKDFHVVKIQILSNTIEKDNQNHVIKVPQLEQSVLNKRTSIPLINSVMKSANSEQSIQTISNQNNLTALRINNLSIGEMVQKTNNGGLGDLYFTVNSGQCSPSDTTDSGTCSDMENSTSAIRPSLKKIAPIMKMNLKNTKIKTINQDFSNGITSNLRFYRTESITDSEESESSLSCDSITGNSSLPFANKLGDVTKLSFLPDSLLRDIRDRKYADNSEEDFYIKNTSCVLVNNEDIKIRHESYENDKYYSFHVNEKDDENFDETTRKPQNEEDEFFAGFKEANTNTSTIRSSKGTVRGVKNRVRNGIATFLQMHQTNVKSFKEKDSGKVVLYTTSMGIVRLTYAKCANVKQILRTLLIKFEERDVFMSSDYQKEIKERMQTQDIQVPQLFVDGHYIGDAETVERLNESGELRKMLKPYKSKNSCDTCQVCGGYRLLPCPSCSGSKKSVHRNHFTTEFVALKCMNCDEVGLVKCYNC